MHRIVLSLSTILRGGLTQSVLTQALYRQATTNSQRK